MLKKWTVPTYLKYFFSYMLIFSIMLLGSFFIIREQLTKAYFRQSIETAQKQLNNMVSQLENDLVYLASTDSALSSNEVLREYRHQLKNYSSRQIMQELKKYTSSSNLIQGIVYLPDPDAAPISTSVKVEWNDGVFHIINPNTDVVVFDPAPYTGSFSGQLVFVSNNTQQYLIYFPAFKTQTDHLFFYILDTTGIQMMMQGFLSQEITSIALLSEESKIVLGVNSQSLIPHLDTLEIKEGFQNIDASSSACINTGIANNFSMVALLSTDFMSEQISHAFSSAYLALMLLSVLGFLLVLLAMRITYLPLSQLMRKITSNPQSKILHLGQLEQVFSDTNAQNQQLIEKLESYRLSIQKYLLDSMFSTQRTEQTFDLDNIDHFFDNNDTQTLFVVILYSPSDELQLKTIQSYFEKHLLANDSCITLELQSNRIVLLISYATDSMDKKLIMEEILTTLHQKYGYQSAFSNCANSLMDIPSLYANAMYATTFWSHMPVVNYTSLPPGSAIYSYPHEKLNKLSTALAEIDFLTAQILIEDIFRIIDRYTMTENKISNFFIHCILIDILTVLINCLAQANINFNDYKDIYLETLYFCRSFPYEKKSAEISANFQKLLDICAQEIPQKLVKSTPLKQVVEQYYCNPDFSVTMLAEHFKVKDSYMSYWFKKEMGVNFIDYLWALRLEKSKELLSTTDMCIDDISAAVGYTNASSFRRKFKQATGESPSHYRERTFKESH